MPPSQPRHTFLDQLRLKKANLCLVQVTAVRLLRSTANLSLTACWRSQLSHLPSKSGMESLEKVSKARRSFPSLDPLRLCLCFLRKKDLRAAAESVFAALLSSLTSDMLSLRENSWSILKTREQQCWEGRTDHRLSPCPPAARRVKAGAPGSSPSLCGFPGYLSTQATEDPLGASAAGVRHTPVLGKFSEQLSSYVQMRVRGNC